ncbi:hypothetical protein Msil_3075 [Methylocella silvestris BL2]|uniref:Uncharacterized protein n=1 Tax=Methylocella silvestris (strain DSM 15510 / CIP 108128 / LMG 27833 / NCIMB 13906 / BL2) TaxID=395965 RepID=B8EKV6_METSB|nr:hypothetical protein Msil_3075 [Methylocella silvestris BL2]
MHKLMVGLIATILGFALLAPEPASAQRWNGSGWNNSGWHGHRWLERTPSLPDALG